MNATEIFANKLVLAPMTKGSNVPFRRLCRELGADVTVGEMALAYKVVKKKRSELALLRTHADDQPFGAQLAARDTASVAEAARVAQELGSSFVDLNCGCPIDLFARRGLGASLMQKPQKLGRLVAAMKAAVSIPVTVKIRAGWSEKKINCLEVARIAREEGADALSLHARTREQRYQKAADWDLVRELKESLDIPVIGNGDLLTWWEVDDKWRASGCDAVMMSRGALIKPWIFTEAREKRTIHLTANQRLDLLERYVTLARDHFGRDEHGNLRVRQFLLWHLSFLCRYRHLPDDEYRNSPRPLLQTRHADVNDGVDVGDPLEVLLARTDDAAHDHVARIAMGEVDRSSPAPEASSDPSQDPLSATSNG